MQLDFPEFEFVFCVEEPLLEYRIANYCAGGLDILCLVEQGCDM